MDAVPLFWGTKVFIRYVLVLLLAAFLAAQFETTAQDMGAAAAAQASAGLSACEGRPAGKATHNCVADVLERFAAGRLPEARSALLRAASGLRAAANKAQAVLAIERCQSVFAAALQQVGASGFAPGIGGTTGLGYVSRVLSEAARLIQTKG
jgi:hypothetical protein